MLSSIQNSCTFYKLFDLDEDCMLLNALSEILIKIFSTYYILKIQNVVITPSYDSEAEKTILLIYILLIAMLVLLSKISPLN